RCVRKQNSPQFLALIIASAEFLLSVRPAQINSRWLQPEIPDKIKAQIKHFRPKIGELLVPYSLLPGHVCAGDESLRARIFPVRLPSHPTHQLVWIKREIANRINSFLLRFQIFVYRRTERSR